MSHWTSPNKLPSFTGFSMSEQVISVNPLKGLLLFPMNILDRNGRISGLICLSHSHSNSHFSMTVTLTFVSQVVGDLLSVFSQFGQSFFSVDRVDGFTLGLTADMTVE